MISKSSIKYSIEKLDTELGKLLIRYYTHNYPIGLMMPLDLEINNGIAPTTEQLHEFIMFYAPVSQLTDAEFILSVENERKSLLAGVDLSHIQNLVVKLPETQPEETNIQPTVTGAKTL